MQAVFEVKSTMFRESYGHLWATFNPADVALDRNGDVHPMSGHGEQFNTAKLDIPKELKGPINICLVTEKPF